MVRTVEQVRDTGRSAAPEAPVSGPIARVVVGSVAIGLVGAAVLTLVVFAGAKEHIITGAALLGFAAGWAALAALTTRLTRQPQRWAFVPAAAMAVVAVGLFVFAPGNHALRSTGWVWPPALLVLTIWMFRQVRRDLHSRTRAWVLYPILAVLVLAAVGGAVETVGETSHIPGPTAGRVVDVGGRRMYLNCTGAGSPTVVLFGGSGEHSSSWAWVAPAVASTTRVCAYDRAGQGWSDGAPNAPQDGAEVAADLHTLLDRAHVPGPYVLAGHSVGGTYALTFAAKYPSDVAGMALVDSSSPLQCDLSWYPGFYAADQRVSALFPTLSRMGVARLAFGSSFGGLPPRARAQERDFVSTPREMRSQRDEFSQLRTVFRQAQALTSLGNKPLFVLSAGKGQKAGWFGAQDKLATLSNNSVRQTAAGATHAALLDDQAQAKNSSQAILAVVASVRTGAPLSR